MIIIKSPREIALMKEAGRILGLMFERLEKEIAPGMSTLDVENICREVIDENGAKSAEYQYYGYPGYVCISVNEEIVHGIASSKKILRDGDIVSVDAVVVKNGYMADACRTYPVGIVSESKLRLIEVTKQAFYNGVSLIKEGIHLGDVQSAIQKTIESAGYSVCRDYTGHGIGTHMHEDPSIPNFGKEGNGPILKEGMTLAIEPMVLMGKCPIRVKGDGWTAVSKDGMPTCHYENTIVVTKDGYEILTKI